MATIAKPAITDTIKHYCLLTKPGILFGNGVNALAGFALASRYGFDPLLFFFMLLGLTFVIGSACVFNNYIDREIDAKMIRTRNRPFVRGVVSVKGALVFGASLGLAGILALTVSVNPLSATIAALGFGVYVVIYSFSKHHSSYATLIGSIAGSVPPVVGYCAVTNRVDIGALLLFLLITFWQMPHFYAIAVYRMKDYMAASIPVLPVKKGLLETKIQMLLYILAYTGTAALFTLTGYTGTVFLVVSLLLGGVWSLLGIQGFSAPNEAAWGRKMFLFSLIVVMATALLIVLN